MSSVLERDYKADVYGSCQGRGNLALRQNCKLIQQICTNTKGIVPGFQVSLVLFCGRSGLKLVEDAG